MPRPFVSCRAARAAARAVVAAVVLAGGLTAAGTAVAPPAASAPPFEPCWAVSFEAPMSAPDRGISTEGVTDTTLRQVAHLSLGGRAVRVTLSNRYGSAPLRVGRTTVADSAGGAAFAAGSVQTLTWDGSPAVTVPVGAQVTSDPVARPVAARSDLVVSTWLAGPTGTLDRHGTATQTLYRGSGNLVTGPASGFTAAGTERYLLTDVQVRTARARTVVFFGDSITDGFKSTPDGNARYPDRVAAAYPFGALPGIANAGISGNQLLVSRGPFGDSGVDRFARDVLARPGVDTVVVLLGVNDIDLSDASAADLAAGYRTIAARARAAGIVTVGATLLPQGRGGDVERTRRQVNTFLRTSGTFDDVVDLDAATRDPARPAYLRAAYDSGDHLHPNDVGYRAIADAVLRTLLAPGAAAG